MGEDDTAPGLWAPVCLPGTGVSLQTVTAQPPQTVRYPPNVGSEASIRIRAAVAQNGLICVRRLGAAGLATPARSDQAPKCIPIDGRGISLPAGGAN